MLVPEPTFVGGKLIKIVDFWKKQIQKGLKGFVNYFSIVEFSQ